MSKQQPWNLVHSFYGLRLFTNNFILKYKFLLCIYWQNVSCPIAIWKCKQRCRVSSYLVEPNFQQNSIVDQQHFFIFHIALALEKSWHDLYHSSIVHNEVKAFWNLNLVKVNGRLRNIYLLTNFNDTNIFHTPENIGKMFLEEKSKQQCLPEKLKSP